MERNITRLIIYGAAAIVLLLGGIFIGLHLDRCECVKAHDVEEVVFSSEDNWTLEGKVYYPPASEGSTPPGILFCHGTLRKGKDTTLYKLLCNELSGRGYLVLAFDIRGFGDSHKVSNFNVPRDCDFIADTHTALDYLQNTLPVDTNRIALVGHSLGGGLAFAVGASSPDVDTIVSIAPGNYLPPDRYSRAVKTHYAEKLGDAVGHDIPLPEWERLVEPLHLFQYLPLAPRHNVCLILAAGDRPDVSRYSEKLYEKLSVNKRLITIPHSNHNFGTEYFEGNELIDKTPVITLAEEIHRWLREVMPEGEETG